MLLPVFLKNENCDTQGKDDSAELESVKSAGNISKNVIRQQKRAPTVKQQKMKAERGSHRGKRREKDGFEKKYMYFTNRFALRS